MGFAVAETACAGWRYAYPAYKTDMVRDCMIAAFRSVLLEQRRPDKA